MAALFGAVLVACRPEALVARAPAEVPSRPAPPPVEYGTTPTSSGIRGGERAEQLYELVRRRFPNLTLVPDGRLADVANHVLVAVEDRGEELPRGEEIEAVANQRGMVGPTPFVFFVPFILGKWTRVEELLVDVPTNARFTHIGVVSRDIGGGAKGVFALGFQHLSMSPVSSQVPENATLRFAGELDPEYRELQWLWMLPDGSTRSIPVAPTRAFSFVTSPLAAGIHRFEALGVGPSGLEVLANLPIAAGRVVAARNSKDDAVAAAEPAEATLLLVNRARARAGAGPLLRAPALDRLAEAHSRDMAENRFFGHDSPTTGDSVQRAFDSGARFEKFGENVARGATVTDVHQSLMDSPGHRRNILDPSFTHVGIGVVHDPSEERLIHVTEVFAVFPAGPLADPPGYAARLFQQINVNRRKAGVESVVRDATLDAVAAAVTARFSAAKDVKRGDVNSLVTAAELQAVGHEFYIFPLFPAGTDELADVPIIVDPEIRRAGVCVVQSEADADHPRTNIAMFVLSR